MGEMTRKELAAMTDPELLAYEREDHGDPYMTLAKAKETQRMALQFWHLGSSQGESLYSSCRERCRHPVKTLHRNVFRLAAPSHVGHYSVRRGSAQGQPTSAGTAPLRALRSTIRSDRACRSWADGSREGPTELPDSRSGNRGSGRESHRVVGPRGWRRMR
jgi:hypothetical protein